MKAKGLFVLTLLGLGICWTMTSCGGGSAVPPSPPQLPAISSISPMSALAGGGNFTLTVDGSNFVNGSTVGWNGSSRSTTFSTSNQLTASISATDISAGGLAQVTVTNPGQNAISNAASFEIDNPVPQLSSVSPATVVVGGVGFTLTAIGANFVSGSAIQWNGNNQPTTLVSGTRLTASIPSSVLALPSGGQAQITVFNPGPGGGGSNSLSVAINNPLPQIASVSPSSLQAGAAPFTLTVNGSNLVQGAVVQWNGGTRTTQFVSDSLLIASIPASDVSAQGIAQVTVFAPPPGGGASSALPFTVQPLTSNPLPVISSLSDTSAPAGWPGFALTINGTGFVAATTGQWNGLNRTTNVLSDAELKSAIPLSDLTASGGAQVTVFNASPGGGTSTPMDFSIKAVAPGTVGVIERSSVATDLTEADANSGSPAISADGRFVAFTSNADNLVPNDTNGVADAFLRDTCIGALGGCVPSVVRVSIASDGTQANQAISDVTISGNGRYVAFTSAATNLVPGVTSGNQNVYMRDTCFGAAAGCTPGTTLVSPDVNNSFSPSLSADGRYIAFTNGLPGNCGSYCSPDNLLTSVRDTCAGAPAGCTPSTNVVSVANDGSTPNDTSIDPGGLISADGRYVAFDSLATNLVANDINNNEDVFLRDTCAGAPAGCNPSTIRVSVATDGSQATGDSVLGSLSITGRFVVFSSNASNLVAGSNNGLQTLFVRDTCVGAAAGCSPSTSLISVGNSGNQVNGNSSQGDITSDGRFVAFTSDATNLISGDTSPFPKIFLRDTCTGVSSGCTPSTVRLSVALDGTPANNQSSSPRLNSNTHYVVFFSLASNLGPGDTNQAFDVFVARTGLP